MDVREGRVRCDRLGAVVWLGCESLEKCVWKEEGLRLWGAGGSREASGSVMRLHQPGPTQSAQLSLWRIPGSVPKPCNQSPLPSGEIAKLK